MTVSTTASTVTIGGNGVTTAFNFSFIGITASDISVTYTDSVGIQILLSPSLYTLILNPPLTGQVWGYGGTVKYPITGDPIAFGTSLTIARIVPLTQNTSLSNQGDFYPKVVEAALDTLCMEIQQVSSTATKSIRFPPSDSSSLNSILPSSSVRANKALGFDASGNVTAIGLPSGSPSNLSSYTATANGGNTTRTLGAFFADVVNVKDYGAIGDGIADDTLAIQTAINTAYGIVFFPSGTYKITSGISIYAGRHQLLGSRAILDFTSLTSGTAFSVGSSSTETYNTIPFMENFIILGPVSNEANNTDGIRIIGNSSAAILNASMRNVHIYGFRDGLILDDYTWAISFFKVNIRGAWRYGIYALSYVLAGENYSFFGCAIYDCIHTAGTAVGYYTPATANADSNFFGCSFDYNDRVATIESGGFTASGCHFEDYNSTPMFYVSSTPGYEAGKLRIFGGEIAGNEAVPGRATFISAAGTRTHIAVTDAGWNRYFCPASSLVTVTSETPMIIIRGVASEQSAGFPAAICNDTSIVYNGLFQTGTLAGWALYPGAGTTQSVDATVYYYGTHSYKTVGTINTTNSDIEQTHTAVSQGGRYLARCYVKTSGVTNGTVFFAVRFLAQDGSTISDVTLATVAGNTDWQLIGNYCTIPRGAYSAVLRLYNYQYVGTTWFNNVQAWIL